MMDDNDLEEAGRNESFEDSLAERRDDYDLQCGIRSCDRLAVCTECDRCRAHCRCLEGP
jgi:hypothetical protein